AARARGIPVGPGRGSAAGSLVAYALGITDIDPLKFDLLFERFLNPERVTMPDIDLDFCFERRSEVIEYMRSRYGRESVGQIITFGTMKARAAFRDVARTLRLEMGDVDRLSKLIPSGPGYALTLAEAAEKVPDLRAAAGQDERVRKILDLGTRIEGLARHASVHAAAVRRASSSSSPRSPPTACATCSAIGSTTWSRRMRCCGPGRSTRGCISCSSTASWAASRCATRIPRWKRSSSRPTASSPTRSRRCGSPTCSAGSRSRKRTCCARRSGRRASTGRLEERRGGHDRRTH